MDLAQLYREQYKAHGPRHIEPAGRRNKYEITVNDAFCGSSGKTEELEREATILKEMQVIKGYLLLVRFRNEDFGVFRNDIINNISPLKTHEGAIVGFAWPEDFDGADKEAWKAHYNAACVMIFKDLQKAFLFFESAKNIKQHDWPSSNGYQVVAVPFSWDAPNSSADFDPFVLTRDTLTLHWTEHANFRRRTDDVLFKERFTNIVTQYIKDSHGCPFICKSDYVATGPPYPSRQMPRVARSTKTSWVYPGTFITISYFPSKRDYLYYLDCLQRYDKGRIAWSIQNVVADTTSVAITLHKLFRTP